jgi:hypothetical protein
MTDQQLVAVLRGLLCSENKPKELTSLDLLQTVRLLIQRADESDLYVSQGTLAVQLCSSTNSIARSQAVLSTLEWLVVRKGGYRGRTNLYTIALDKLPTADLTRTVVSNEARQFATEVGTHLRVTKRKKFMRGWHQQWAFGFQKLIDRTNGDAGQVSRVLNFAFNHPSYAKKAERGPAALLRVWKPLQADFKKAAEAVKI